MKNFYHHWDLLLKVKQMQISSSILKKTYKDKIKSNVITMTGKASMVSFAHVTIFLLLDKKIKPFFMIFDTDNDDIEKQIFFYISAKKAGIV